MDKNVDDDSLGRKSVFGLLKSEAPSNKTILLHAHSDTVKTDDFGELKDLANQPEKMKEMKHLYLSQD